MRLMRPAIALALFALTIASGCGPDCAAYCQKLKSCDMLSGKSTAEDDCVASCNDVGTDRARTVSCVVSNAHTCTDIKSGHCHVSGNN